MVYHTGVLYVQVKVSDVGLMEAVGCAADYYTSLLNSSLKSSIAWSVLIFHCDCITV